MQPAVINLLTSFTASENSYRTFHGSPYATIPTSFRFHTSIFMKPRDARRFEIKLQKVTRIYHTLRTSVKGKPVIFPHKGILYWVRIFRLGNDGDSSISRFIKSALESRAPHISTPLSADASMNKSLIHTSTGSAGFQPASTNPEPPPPQFIPGIGEGWAT